MTTSIMKNKLTLPLNKALKQIFIVFIILALWECAALLINDSYFLPDIAKTLVALAKIVVSKGFFNVVFTGIYRVFAGLFIGTFISILLATLCYKITFLKELFSPFISIMKATPVACIIVLLWIRFNYTQIAILVVVLMVTPIIWQNVLDGYESIDSGLFEVTEVFELNAAKKIRFLYIPSLLNYLIPALITSVGLAWKAEVAAEIMTNSNIGRLIYDYKTVSYDTASIFAWTVIIVSMSILFETLTKRLLRRLMNGLNN